MCPWEFRVFLLCHFGHSLARLLTLWLSDLKNECFLQPSLTVSTRPFQLLHADTCFRLLLCQQSAFTYCDSVIYKKYIFGYPDGLNISHINLVFVHGSWLTGPKTLGIFLHDKSSGSPFCHNICSLVLCSWNSFRAVKVKWMSCYSQQAPFYHNWVYINEVTLEST